MDRISELPEHLLLKILSFLPTTKDVMATMVLSKRWQFLWMLVPRLIYDDSNENITKESFSRFVDRSLLLHNAPVLESLEFKLGQKFSDVDIGVWATTVARRHVRELVVDIDRSSCAAPPAILPKSLYMVSGMLVTLKINNMVLADASSPVSFPSLKGLSLESIKYPGGDEFVDSLLSSCHVLEDLSVKRCPDDNVTIFTVRVPSLKILTMLNKREKTSDDAEGVVIDVPSLKTLVFDDYTGGFWVLENDMPNIVTADIDIRYSHPGKIMGFLTSVKDLLLCLSSAKDAYHSGRVFHCLGHFTLCRCDQQWLNLLMCVLRDSPKLGGLKLDQYHGS